jgi:CheY-like chemotaxis protein
MSRPRILLVEDEAMVALMMEDMLEDLGCDVAASFGEVGPALAWLSESGEVIDGAVLDVNLAGQTVFPVADMLLAKGTPFVFLTGYNAVPQARSYAAQVLNKPVDQGALGAMLASFTA